MVFHAAYSKRQGYSWTGSLSGWIYLSFYGFSYLNFRSTLKCHSNDFE